MDGGHEIAGVALAGGMSARMGTEKAFVRLRDATLLELVVARFRPQVATIFLSANGDAARFGAFRVDVVPDAPRWRQGGPLAGVSAALRHARAIGFAELATVPCDTPFLPLDLVARLKSAKDRTGAIVAVARNPRGLEPMFALWGVGALEALEAALARGEKSPRKVLAALFAAEVAFEAGDGPDPFANLNAAEDVADAAKFAL